MDKKVLEKSKISLRFSEIRAQLCQNSNRIFAERVGIDEQRASNYCSGSKIPGLKVIERVAAAFPEVSTVWLMTGEGNMLIEGEEEKEATEVEELRQRVADLEAENKRKDETIASLVRILDGRQGEMPQEKKKLG